MKKTVKKAQVGKGPIKPTYKNLKMGVMNEYEQATGERRDVKATGTDSANYVRGFKRGLAGGKEYPGERNVEKMGRWEGQNATKKKEAPKKAAPKKKLKSGGALKPVDASKQKGLGKLPTEVRNKMGYQKTGGKTKKVMKGGGKCRYGCK